MMQIVALLYCFKVMASHCLAVATGVGMNHFLFHFILDIDLGVRVTRLFLFDIFLMQHWYLRSMYSSSMSNMRRKLMGLSRLSLSRQGKPGAGC